MFPLCQRGVHAYAYRIAEANQHNLEEKLRQADETFICLAPEALLFFGFKRCVAGGEKPLDIRAEGRAEQ